MPEYSHPKGPLNLLSYLKDNSVKPDLGPKSYVAFGRCRPSTSMPWLYGASSWYQPTLPIMRLDSTY